MEKRTYDTLTKEAILAQIHAEGKMATEDAVIDIVDGTPSTMFFMVQDALPAPETEVSDLQAYYDGMSEVLEGE
jgi:hypothetical protein